MIPWSVELIGGQQFAAYLALVTATTEKRVRDAVNTRALEIVTKAKAVCPVKTGRLRASIHAEFSAVTGGIAAEIGTDVFYAPIVEFGLGRRPKPYLYPAFNEVAPKLQADLERILGSVA